MMMLLMALPVVALALFYVLPFRTALPIYIALSLYSAFIWVKMFGAMKIKVKTGLQKMVGQEAVVIQDLNPEGQVEVGDEIWSATAEGQKLHKGEKVRIRGYQGLILTVESPSKREGDRTSTRHGAAPGPS